MGNPLSTSKPSSKVPHISLLSLESSGSSQLLVHLSAHDPSHPSVDDEIPQLGFNLQIVRATNMTVTRLPLGVSRPRSFTADFDWISANTDGIALLVDCRNRDYWEDVLFELSKLALEPEALQRSPLLVLANHSDAEVSPNSSADVLEAT